MDTGTDTQPSHEASRSGRAPVLELAGRLLVPVLVLAYAVAFLVSIADLGPKAATYPRIVIALLGPLTLWVLLAELWRWRRSRASSGGTTRSRLAELSRQWRRPLVAMVTLAAFAFAVPRVGFFVSAGVYLLVTMLLLGVRNVWVLVALTAGGLLFSYLFFFRLLGLLLPTGVLV